MTYWAEILTVLLLAGIGFYLKFGHIHRRQIPGMKSGRDAFDDMQRSTLADLQKGGARHVLTSLMPGPNFCEPARRQSTLRYSLGEQPALPLTDCSHPESCACRYQRLADRRRGDRRQDATSNEYPAARQRRSGQDRRKDKS